MSTAANLSSTANTCCKNKNGKREGLQKRGESLQWPSEPISAPGSFLTMCYCHHTPQIGSTVHGAGSCKPAAAIACCNRSAAGLRQTGEPTKHQGSFLPAKENSSPFSKPTWPGHGRLSPGAWAPPTLAATVRVGVVAAAAAVGPPAVGGGPISPPLCAAAPAQQQLPVTGHLRRCREAACCVVGCSQPAKGWPRAPRHAALDPSSRSLGSQLPARSTGTP